MPKHGKRYRQIAQLVEKGKRYSLQEAVALAKKAATAKFDESIDIALHLGVDPRKADQMVRGSVVLPHGTGKEVRVLVFAKPPVDKEALEAGADYAGLEEYVEKIQSGWLEFDVAIATPDVMPIVGRLGRILGPRGLMPNPKSGTVTTDVAKAVREVKAGKVEFRVDKGGNIHASIGRKSFEDEKLIDNIRTFVHSVLRAKPAAAKGKYLRSVHISPTMGVGIPIDEREFA